MSRWDEFDLEMRELIAAYCDGQATPEQIGHLESALENDALGQRVLLDALQIDAELHLLVRGDHAFALAMEKLASSGSSPGSKIAGRLQAVANKSSAKKSPVLGFLANWMHNGGELAGASLFQWAVLALLGMGSVMMLAMVAVLVSGRFDRAIPDDVAAGGQRADGDGQNNSQSQVSNLKSEISNSKSATNPAASPRLSGEGHASGSPPQFAARLNRVADVHWLDHGDAPKQGDDLYEGRRVSLDSGTAEFYFQGGAKLLLQGPAELEFLSRASARLVHGSLTVTVENPLARGFEIHTPGMKFTDLGTEFGVRISPDGVQEMHVFRGRVSAEAEPISVGWTSSPSKKNTYGLDVRPTANPEANASGSPANPSASPASGQRPTVTALVVTADQALKIAAPGKPIEKVTADEKKFVRANDFAAAVGGKATEFARWKQFSEELRQRKDLVAYYDFQPDESDRTVLRNRAAAGAQYDGKLVGGVQWTQGRIPGKGALHFDQRKGGVRIDIPDELPQLTLVAWMKFDASPQYGALLDSAQLTTGGVDWAIFSKGQVLFHCFLHNNISTLSKPTFGADATGWRMVASTYDSARGKIAHYFDGNSLGTHTVPSGTPAKLGKAMIGNFDHAGLRNIAPNDDRPLRGCMDELVILRSALASEAVRAMYDATK